jgi:hypothetical protein
LHLRGAAHALARTRVNRVGLDGEPRARKARVCYRASEGEPLHLL